MYWVLINLKSGQLKNLYCSFVNENNVFDLRFRRIQNTGFSLLDPRSLQPELRIRPIKPMGTFNTEDFGCFWIRMNRHLSTPIWGWEL